MGPLHQEFQCAGQHLSRCWAQGETGWLGLRDASGVRT